MSGKHYNRAVRLHKVTYEALMRLLEQVFETFVTSETSAVTVEEKKQIEQLKQDFVKRNAKKYLTSRNIQQFVSNLKEKEGDLAKFSLRVFVTL